MSIWTVMLMKTFPFLSLLWNCLFVLKRSLRTLLVICPRLKLCFCTSSTLLTTYFTLYQINCHFWVTIVLPVILCTSFKSLLLKVHLSFIFSHKWQGSIFLHKAWTYLPTLSKSGNCDLTKFLLPNHKNVRKYFLMPIIRCKNHM